MRDSEIERYCAVQYEYANPAREAMAERSCGALGNRRRLDDDRATDEM